MRSSASDIRAVSVAGIALASFLLLAGADRAGPGLPATPRRRQALQLLLAGLARAALDGPSDRVKAAAN